MKSLYVRLAVLVAAAMLVVAVAARAQEEKPAAKSEAGTTEKNTKAAEPAPPADSDDAGFDHCRWAAHRLHRDCRHHHGGRDRHRRCAAWPGRKAAARLAACALGAQGSGRCAAGGAHVLRGVFQDGRQGRGPADHVLLQRRAGQLDHVAAHGLAGAEVRGDRRRHASARGPVQAG